MDTKATKGIITTTKRTTGNITRKAQTGSNHTTEMENLLEKELSTHKIFGVISIKNMDTPPIGVLTILIGQQEENLLKMNGATYTRNMDTPPRIAMNIEKE
jgi:hypothetical protein